MDDGEEPRLSQKHPLVLVGAGKMGGALLDGWIANGLEGPAGVIVDPGLDDTRGSALQTRELLINPDRRDIAEPGALVLAVKPQIMDEVLRDIAPVAGPRTLVISIAAGITIRRFAAAFGPEAAIVRAMPNTPASIGQGITVCCANANVSEEQRQTCTALMEAVGSVAWIEDEAQMDAVTAVSGSGPAYVFHLTECLTAAGVKLGLDEDLAKQLARATVAGAGQLMVQSGLEAHTLRENVTSPNGTTQAALDVLMGTGALAKLMRETVSAAARRSRELSQ